MGLCREASFFLSVLGAEWAFLVFSTRFGFHPDRLNDSQFAAQYQKIIF